MLNPIEGEVFCFDKPYAMTSFRIVSKVRGILHRRLGVKNLKVGHAGTLDPLATGVLLVCTGKATKDIDRLQADTKEYVATIRLGATTPSFDMEHPEDATFPTSHITREAVEQTLQRFLGRIEQVPPTFSAVRVNGKRAFKLARKGEEVELKPKILVIDEIELLDCQLTPDASRQPRSINIKDITPEEAAQADAYNRSLTPSITVRIVCSKGTYIRALARDIGAALGTGAYLQGLRRTRIGQYDVAQSIRIEDFEAWADSQDIVLPATSQPSQPIPTDHQPLKGIL